jgi:hypothetical protein
LGCSNTGRFGRGGRRPAELAPGARITDQFLFELMCLLTGIPT